MSASRWIRLDTTWSQSEWVAAMSPEARLAWVELLCHVKAHGYSGAAKRLAPSVFARVTGVTRNAVEEMEDAALRDEALLIDGDDWVVTGWGEYQTDPTAAERVRRYRERRQQDTELSTGDDVTRNRRNVTDVTPTETETETTTTLVDPWPTKPKKVKGQYEYPEPFERAWREYPHRDGPNPKVGAYKAFRARVKSGDDPEELVLSARHYRQDLESRQRDGTEFVRQAASFWGRDEPFREFVAPTPTNGTTRRGSKDSRHDTVEYRPASEVIW